MKYSHKDLQKCSTSGYPLQGTEETHRLQTGGVILVNYEVSIEKRTLNLSGVKGLSVNITMSKRKVTEQILIFYVTTKVLLSYNTSLPLY